MTGVPPRPRALARGKSPQRLGGVHAPRKRWLTEERETIP